MKLKNKIVIMVASGLLAKHLHNKNIDKSIKWYYRIVNNK